MRSRLPCLPFTLVALLAGCVGGESSDHDDTVEGSEAALTSRDIPNVAAIAVETRRPPRNELLSASRVAHPPKVAKLMRALKTQGAGGLHCQGSMSLPVTTLRFLDAAGDELAKGRFSCGRGRVTSGEREIRFTVTGDFHEVVGAPTVPADVLFGTDAIEVTRRQGATKEATIDDPAAIAKVLGAMDLAGVDPQPAVPSCLPSHTLVFKRKRTKLAVGSYGCANQDLAAKMAMRFEADSQRTPENDPIVGRLDVATGVIDDVLRRQ